MRVAIHQPQYIPWLGYFDKIHQADIFVLLDDVQFKKNEWQNRNRIRNTNEWQWLTVPVCHKFGQNINEVLVNNNGHWRQKHKNALWQNYQRAAYFRLYEGDLMDMYEKSWDKLVDINIAFIELCVRLLGIKTPIMRASRMDISSARTQRLVDICQCLGANRYLSGQDGPSYMDMSLFQQACIHVDVQHYQCPQYTQAPPDLHYNQFISHLSIIDLLLNHGPDSLGILTAPLKESEGQDIHE